MFGLILAGEDGALMRLLYDPHVSTLIQEDGTPVDLSPVGYPYERREFGPDAPAFSRETPLGKRTSLKVVKISLGLACNYACAYCVQRFVPHADHGNVDDVHAFLAKLPTWFDGGEDGQGAGVRFELWGGEPLVYWKKLKVLAGAIRSAYPNAAFSIISNGSLLDNEKIDWLDVMGFSVGISHDGPGQGLRGPDPFNDPDKAEYLRQLYRRLKPEGRISFNTVLNRYNYSYGAIRDYFTEKLGDPELPVGEGGLITPYDAGGLACSPETEDERKHMRLALVEEVIGGRARNFGAVHSHIHDFYRSLAEARPSRVLDQKCGMDREETVTVDLKGRVVTCQNVSASATAPNGRPHRIGHVDNLDNIRLDTATHWRHREHCSHCPVLQLCKGSCMFLEGDLWNVACHNSFTLNLAYITAALYFLTGKILVEIEGDVRRPPDTFACPRNPDGPAQEAGFLLPEKEAS